MCSLLRQEYEFVEPIGIACNLVVVALCLVAYDESLQVGGMLEAALLNIGYRLWQDDGLQLVAEIEHIVARLVVGIDEVVWTVTLVRVNLVLLQFGTVKISVIFQWVFCIIERNSCDSLEFSSLLHEVSTIVPQKDRMAASIIRYFFIQLLIIIELQ